MSNHYLIKPNDALHQTGIRPWALTACSNAAAIFRKAAIAARLSPTTINNGRSTHCATSMLTRKPPVYARAISMLTATTVYDRLTNDGLAEWHPVFLWGKASTLAGSVTKPFCQRYSPKKKAWRACAWGSQLFPPGLLKNSAGVFPAVPPSSCALVRPTIPTLGRGRSGAAPGPPPTAAARRRRAPQRRAAPLPKVTRPQRLWDAIGSGKLGIHR